MKRHHAVRADPQIQHFHRFFQKVNKAEVVFLPLENRLAPSHRVHNVIPRIRILYSQWPRHSTSPPHSTI